MNQSGRSQKEISQKLSSILPLDDNFESGKIIGSMCTKPDLFSQKIYSKYLEKNIGDPGLLKGTLLIEKEVINMLGNLLSKSKPAGYVISGGTEANILAMWSARNHFQKNSPEVIIPSHSHHSFDKAADLLGINLIKIPCIDGVVDTNLVEKRINKNTIMLIGVAGTTPLGLIDPIDLLSDIARRHSLFLHVDASFGGFIIPFLQELGYDLPLFDFKLPGVTSISIDSHKMGIAPIPSSCILFRKRSLLKNIKFNAGYLSGGSEPRTILLGTSPGASIIALWALLNYNGKEGYTKIANRCMRNTNYLYHELLNIPNLSVISKPIINIIGFKLNSGSQKTFVTKIRKQGWSISVFPTHIRIVLMPHIRRTHINAFLTDLKKITKKPL